VARYCAGLGRLWFAVTLRLAGQGLGWAVPASLALAFVCLVLAVIDAVTRLLPNRITYPAFPVVAGLLLVASLGLGELDRLGRGLLAAASVGGLFLLLALLSPHGMGVGDVKLAPTLGLALGWLSWGTVAVGVSRLPARRPGGAGRHAGTWPIAQVAAAVRPLAGRRCAAGRPGRRRGRRLVPGRLARRQ
jgi:prepilin signal peptidase PulO-like enzyme (type II secretory pathway)